MSRYCFVTDKRTIVGNKVSHSNRKTKRKFFPNLHKKRFWISSENRYIRLLVSSKGIKCIDKIGIEKIFNNIKKS
jgi:large subunit ribosomal protein L28